ncbi:MAG TPA: YceI family protein [Lacipirellulaceae bacterium]|nr:YceI family protein [Lacipirellulaceae bacterium]
MIRSKIITWSPVVISLLTSSSVFAADYYKMDPEHTSVVFGIAHARLSYTYGMFRKTAGQYWLDKNDPANCRFQMAIRASSIDTNNAERDNKLRSDEFFDVQRFPEIRFESTRCELADSPKGAVTYKLAGKLTVHGVTLPVDNILLHMLGAGPGASGKDRRTGFLCYVELKRSDFGMKNLLKNDLVGDAVGITVSFEGALQPAAGAAPQINPERP